MNPSNREGLFIRKQNRPQLSAVEAANFRAQLAALTGEHPRSFRGKTLREALEGAEQFSGGVVIHWDSYSDFELGSKL